RAVHYGGGSPRTTTVVNGTLLRASIPASDVAAAGTANVTVSNPAPGGGASSARSFLVAARATDDPASAPAAREFPLSNTRNTLTAATSASNPTPPCGSHSRARGVWMTYTAPVDGVLTITTPGSNYQTNVSAWTGAPGAFANA